MKFLFVSDFDPDPDAGSAGSILDVGGALSSAGHDVEYLWKEDQPYWMPHPFLTRWQELPRRQFRQIGAHLEHNRYDVVMIFQPYAYRAFEVLPALYPQTLFLNGTYGWEDRLHGARLKFEWDGPFSMSRRLSLRVSKALINRLCRRTARAAHGIVTPTMHSADYIRAAYGLSADKVHVVPTGLGERFLASNGARDERAPVRMLYVGNYLPLKGSRVLEAILPDLGRAYPDMSMTFVVQRHVTSEVRDKFEPAFGSRLTVLPWRSRASMPELYGAHDVLIFPSLFEGFGRVMLEAMACGLCVVGFAEGGLPDIATFGSDAFFCPAGNVETLRDLIEGCLKDPAMARAVGRRASVTVQRYSTALSASLIEGFAIERRRVVLGSPGGRRD